MKKIIFTLLVLFALFMLLFLIMPRKKFYYIPDQNMKRGIDFTVYYEWSFFNEQYYLIPGRYEIKETPVNNYAEIDIDGGITPENVLCFKKDTNQKIILTYYYGFGKSKLDTDFYTIRNYEDLLDKNYQLDSNLHCLELLSEMEKSSL